MTDTPPNTGPLRNQRHEIFCNAIARGFNQSDSYRQAGYVGTDQVIRSGASQLMDKPAIKARVAELMEARKGFILTKDWLIGEMVDVAQATKADSSHSPRIRALELLGREKGAFTEQREYTVRSITQLSSEEIEGMLAELESRPGRDNGKPAPAPDRGGKGRTGKAKEGRRAQG